MGKRQMANGRGESKVKSRGCDLLQKTMRQMADVFANVKWVFLLALVVRLLVVAQGYDGDPQDTPEYEEIAHNLLAGQGFVASYWWYGFELRSWRAPFYPFFLAGVYGVFGYEQWVVRVIQCVVGALTAALLVGIAKNMNAKIVPWCGVLAIFYGPLVSVSNEIMTETWFIFWLVLGVYCLFGHKRCGWLAGVALGCAVLTRPVGALLLVAWIIFAWVRHLDWQMVLRVCAVATLVVLPWTVRNYFVHGEWPILSTQGGFIVAHSNALMPDWKKDVGWGTTRAFLDSMPSELARDRYWWQQGLAFVKAHPMTYAQLVFERFVRFWYFFRPDYNFWWMLILPFGCVGLWHKGLYKDYLLLTLFMGLSVLIFSSVLYGAARFRLPLEAFFLVFVGPGFRYLQERWGHHLMMRVGCGWGIVQILINWQEVWLRQELLAVIRALGMK